jgi:hypothetical protein
MNRKCRPSPHLLFTSFTWQQLNITVRHVPVLQKPVNFQIDFSTFSFLLDDYIFGEENQNDLSVRIE